MDVINQLLEFRAQFEKLVDILTSKSLLTDEEALEIPLLFKVWEKPPEGKTRHMAKDGTYWRCPFDGNLYVVIQEHDAPCDDNYAPSRAHSLYRPVANPGEDGSREHPYSFVQGMKLEAGKYYRQNGVLYRCILGVEWLYDDLKNVVGHYVEVVT